MSIVKNVEWSVQQVVHSELEEYLNKMAADGYELFEAADHTDWTLVIMHKTIPSEGDWRTAVGSTTNSELINKLRQKSMGHANE